MRNWKPNIVRITDWVDATPTNNLYLHLSFLFTYYKRVRNMKRKTNYIANNIIYLLMVFDTYIIFVFLHVL